MNNHYKNHQLPDKVIRKLHELTHRVVLSIEQSVMLNKRPADKELSAWFRSRKELGSRDRRFLSRVVFSYFRWHGWTQNNLRLSLDDSFLIADLLESETRSQWAAYLSNKSTLSSIPEPMGALTLNEKSQSLGKCLKKTLLINELLPDDYQNIISHDEPKGYVNTFQYRPPTWMRVRSNTEELIKSLENENISALQHSHITNAVAIRGGTNLNQKLSKRLGQFVIQDIASQCVALICMPMPGQIWWDCCAGSGGKSLHLADIMQQQGGIFASDVREASLSELKKRARTCGIKTIRTQKYNLLEMKESHHHYDGVLVDAPCSGWGVWGRNPDARWRTSAKDVYQYAKKQKILLNNAAVSIKDGGILVYAVCTITKQETTEVIDHFLEKNPLFKYESFLNPMNNERCDGFLQIFPQNYDGMFIAKLRKTPKE